MFGLTAFAQTPFAGLGGNTYQVSILEATSATELLTYTVDTTGIVTGILIEIGLSSPLVWQWINNGQSTSWTAIQPPVSVAWQSINNEQSAGWTEINNEPAQNWATINDNQTPDWVEVKD